MNKIKDFEVGTVYVSQLGNEFMICDCDYDKDETLYNLIYLNAAYGDNVRMFNNPVNREETIKKLNSISSEIELKIK